SGTPHTRPLGRIRERAERDDAAASAGRRETRGTTMKTKRKTTRKQNGAKASAKKVQAKRVQAKRAAKPLPRLKAGIGRVPAITPGKYADGMPYNQVKYVECKLILRPNHFTSRGSFFDFAKLMRRPARETGVEFSMGE